MINKTTSQKNTNDSKKSDEEVSRYCFGISSKQLGKAVLFIKRKDRLSEYISLLDDVTEFQGKIWSGVRGRLGNEYISIIVAGVSPSLIGDCVYALGKANLIAVYSGTCGGIGLEIGDFIISEQCVGGDGFSQQLKHDFESTVKGNEKCSKLMFGCLKKEGFNVSLGKTYTTASFIAENDFLFQKKSALKNCIGIEMGAAAFYAACQRNGIAGGAYFWVTDLPFEGKSFYQELSANEMERKRKIYDKIPAIDLKVLKILIMQTK
jgi:uridine phosphorylase